MARVTRTEDERLIIAFHIKQMTNQYNTGMECAEKFGVPASQWSAWTNGKRTPGDERLADIAKFFKVSVEDLKTAPPNWNEEKPKFIAEHYQKKGGTPFVHAPERDADVPAQNDEDDGTDDYIAIVTALAKVQAKYNKGQISTAKYESSMKSIREFIDFSYRDIKA